MSRWARRLQRLRGDRGAILVEAAIITPLLLLLVFGIIEFGLLFKDTSTVSAATASGARTASTQARNSAYATNAAAATAAALNSGGATPESLIIFRLDRNGSHIPVEWTDAQIQACTACYKFTWNGSSWSPVGATRWESTSQQTCGTLPYTDYVGVWVRARHDMVTGMFGGARSITEKTVMRLEPVPGTCP